MDKLETKVTVVKQKAARAFYEGPELCREYFKTEKLTLGTSTLEPGQTGAVDWGHKASHEIFFVIRGRVTLRTPHTEERYELEEGDAVLIPQTVPHELTNTGTQTAVVSWSLAPSEL